MLFDIGLGELLLIAVLALLVFGPDRLPRAAADAAKLLRQVRTAATSARRDLVDAAGLDGQDELSSALRDLKDLDPRRVLGSILDDPGVQAPDAAAGPASARPAGSQPGAPQTPGAARQAANPGPTAGSGTGPGSAGPVLDPARGGDRTPAPAAGQPSAGTGPGAASADDVGAVDPDWT